MKVTASAVTFIALSYHPTLFYSLLDITFVPEDYSMGRRILQIIVIGLVGLNAGYMVYDAFGALINGDYIRPTDGEYAGQLGPWTMFAGLANIDPMSTLMKSVFLILGSIGLLGLLLYIVKPRLGSTVLLLFCFLTLWNLIFGSITSFITIIILLAWRKLYRAARTKATVLNTVSEPRHA